MCTGKILFLETRLLVWLHLPQAHSVPKSLVFIRLGVHLKNTLCSFSFLFKTLALICWEIKWLQYLALVYVPFQKLLVILLVLVRHAKLAWRLWIPEEFLLDWRIKLLFFLLNVREACRRFYLDREWLLSRQFIVLGQFLPLLEIYRACNA